MKKLIFLLMFISGSATIIAQDRSSQRILVLPFSVDSQIEEPWEGLAPVLALHSLSDDSRLVPFTACRRKLNEFGLSIVLPTSLATRVTLARQLDADIMVSGHIEQNRLLLVVYNVNRHDLKRHILLPETGGGYAAAVANTLGLEYKQPGARQYDLYRVWASVYFVDEPESSRSVMSRLLENDLTGWSFLQEYLDLYGDPTRNLMEASEKAWWRDLYLDKQHLDRALQLSRQIMDARHHPRDFIAHARILLAQDEFGQACVWLEKAESFGFMDEQLAEARRQCNDPSKRQPPETDIR